MSFMTYDLILLAIFALVIGSFLYRKRKKIQKEGLLLLYRTEWGIKLIDYVGNKYKKTLKVSSYISVALGYLLTVGVIWLFYTILKVYIFRPDVVSAVKVPPIMPLVPYIDKVVPFLPPFYFTYWIVILAVIAITHEFAHGIFAAYNKVKIKKTGFGFFPFFLPVFLAAFVELDEKVMQKKKNFSQRAILSAGTFANTVTAVVFFVVLALFFVGTFHPAGVSFDDYYYQNVEVSGITMINGIAVANPNMESLSNLAENSSFNNITVGEENYIGIRGFSPDGKIVSLYSDAPAISTGLQGAITEIDGQEITSKERLSQVLDGYSPGDTVEIKTETRRWENVTEVTLVESPGDSEEVWLGVAFYERSSEGLMGKIFASLSSFKKPNIYYESSLGEFGWFIYNLLWWLIIISISVALINMLPMGIFDGGRFFYLTILAITGKEKWARKSFGWATAFFLLVILVLMIFWAYALLF